MENSKSKYATRIKYIYIYIRVLSGYIEIRLGHSRIDQLGRLASLKSRLPKATTIRHNIGRMRQRQCTNGSSPSEIWSLNTPRLYVKRKRTMSFHLKVQLLQKCAGTRSLELIGKAPDEPCHAMTCFEHLWSAGGLQQDEQPTWSFVMKVCNRVLPSFFQNVLECVFRFFQTDFTFG